MYPSSLYVHVFIFYVFITYVFSLNCDDYASILKEYNGGNTKTS